MPAGILISQAPAAYFPSLLVSSGEAIAVVVGVSLLLLALRWPILRLRARSPRVQVATFAWVGSATGAGNTDARWVSSLFREKLTALKLAPLDALPGGSSGPPLVEIVESVGEGVGDKSQLGKAVGRLFRTVLPEAAYEVSGTLKPSGPNKGTVAVQIVDRSQRNKTLLSVVLKDADWRVNARTAAAKVAGALYPLVANRHQGTWCHWTSAVPSELIELYDEARTHEKHDRLEQALGVYHLALDQDPLNPTLRLRIAMLQERLELHLGAWATYRAVAQEPHRNAWKGPNRHVRLLALYRLAILLGKKEVAKRWVSPGEDPAETRDRTALLDALKGDRLLIRTTWLRRSRLSGLARYWPKVWRKSSSIRLLDELRKPELPNWSEEEREEWVAARLNPAGDDENAAVDRVQQLLEVLSLAHLEQLDARMRRRPPWRPSRWRREWWRYRLPVRQSLRRREFSLSAVRVSKLLARLRIAAGAERRLAGNATELSRVKRAHAGLRRQWPFPPTALRWPARVLRPRHRLADRRDDAWQYHYNAACTVSVALPPDLAPEPSNRFPDDTRLIGAALEQLEEYAHHAGSHHVHTQADWVAGEDDDLIALRRTREYERWAGHHLPEKRAVQTRIHTKRIAARIAHGGARAFAASWRARAEHDGARAEVVATWWEQESEAWQALDTIFSGHQSWRKRWEGIDGLQACLRAGGEPELIDASHRPEDRAAAAELSDSLLELLTRLARATPGVQPAVPISRWTEKRAGKVRNAYETGAEEVGQRGLESEPERREALRAFRIWQGIADALEAELAAKSNGVPGEQMRKCLRDIRLELARQNGSWPSRAKQFANGVLQAITA